MEIVCYCSVVCTKTHSYCALVPSWLVAWQPLSYCTSCQMYIYRNIFPVGLKYRQGMILRSFPHPKDSETSN